MKLIVDNRSREEIFNDTYICCYYVHSSMFIDKHIKNWFNEMTIYKR